MTVPPDEEYVTVTANFQPLEMGTMTKIKHSVEGVYNTLFTLCCWLVATPDIYTYGTIKHGRKNIVN